MMSSEGVRTVESECESSCEPEGGTRGSLSVGDNQEGE